MSQGKRSLLARLWGGISGLMPDGGIGDEGPPPDVDGRRDTDTAYKRAVLTTKSQFTQHGAGTTSYQSVERGKKND